MAALPFLSYAVAIGITIPIYLLVDRNVMAQRAKWYDPKLGRRLGQMAYALVGIGLLLGLLFHEFGPLRGWQAEIRVLSCCTACEYPS